MDRINLILSVSFQFYSRGINGLNLFSPDKEPITKLKFEKNFISLGFKVVCHFDFPFKIFARQAQIFKKIL